MMLENHLAMLSEASYIVYPFHLVRWSSSSQTGWIISNAARASRAKTDEPSRTSAS